MKKYILLSLFLFCFMNYSNAINPQIVSKEILISTQYKLIEKGQFLFLIFISDTEVKELTYSYSINKKQNKIVCSKGQSRIINIRDNKSYLKSINFETSKKFEQKHTNTWREKYYKYFSPHFLKLSNKEKIMLLDSFTSNEI